MTALTRRSLLALPVALAWPVSPVLATANQGLYVDFWTSPRSLWLYRAETGEGGTFEYWRDGRLQLEAWYALLYLLRDVRAGVMMHYDPKVVDVTWAVQEWSHRDAGKRSRLRLTDGARTEATNASTPHADPASLHREGKALDGQLEGVGLGRYAQAARFFRMGGVGLYSTHVHVDSGSYRKWGF